jgi:agmatinase
MKEHSDFLGSEVSGSDRDRAFVIPVPLEWSTSYGRGTARAPAAMLAASHQIELYHPGLELDLEGVGIRTFTRAIAGRESLVSVVKEHRPDFEHALACFLGGEHSITPWILEGLDRADIGIVWLDAHADLRGRYLGERESHACAARNSLPFGPIVEIGVRSYSREERDFIGSSDRVQVFGPWDRDAEEAIRKLPEDVYLSLDFDVMDPSVIRAVGTPEPGGLSWQTLMALFDYLFSRKRVIAMDAVELCPAEGDEASNFIAAKIVYEAIARYLKKELDGEA